MLFESAILYFLFQFLKILENVNSNVCIAHSKDVSSYG